MKKHIATKFLTKQGYYVVYLYEENKSTKLQTLVWCEK